MKTLKKEEFSSVNGGLNIPNWAFPQRPNTLDNSWAWEGILGSFTSTHDGFVASGAQGAP